MTKQKKRFKATKISIRYTFFVTLFIFVVSVSFLVSSIVQNISSQNTNSPITSSSLPTDTEEKSISGMQENSFIPNDIGDDTHHLTPNTLPSDKALTTTQHSLAYTNLAKIFDTNNFNNNLIPQLRHDLKNKLDQNSKHFTEIHTISQNPNALDIFTFQSGNSSNPMDVLSTLIYELYTNPEEIQNSKKENTHNTPIFELLHIAQDVNQALTKTFHDYALPQKDILYVESALRVNNELNPYPFLVVELRNNQKENAQNTPYFTDKNQRTHFIQALKKNLQEQRANTLFTSTKKRSIHIVDEDGFIYISYENIISHVIRLEKRKERLEKNYSRKHDEIYCTMIIDDFGENYTLARKFMDLPFPIIFSIWPLSTHSTKIATVAHEKGFPIFLHQPMQAMPIHNHRAPDMGKSGLTIDMTQEEMKSILQHNLLSVPNARGINNHMGSLFTSTPHAVGSFLRALKSLMPHIIIIDSITHAKSCLFKQAQSHNFLSAQRHYFIDNNDQNTNKELQNVYEHAKKNTHVIAIGHAREKTLKALQNWKAPKEDNLIFTLP